MQEYVHLGRSRQELSNEYLAWTSRHRLRYSRQRASQTFRGEIQYIFFKNASDYPQAKLENRKHERQLFPIDGAELDSFQREIDLRNQEQYERQYVCLL